MLIHRDGWRYSGKTPEFFNGQAGCFCCAASVTNLYRSIFGNLAGGSDTAQNYEYTGSWTARTSASHATQRRSAGGIADGVGYFAYGLYYNGMALVSECDKYTSSGDSWTSLTSPSGTALKSRSGTMPAKFYCFLGDDASSVCTTNADEYDPAGNSWASKTAASGVARTLSSAANNGTDCWNFGGVDASLVVYTRTDKYSVSGNSWSTQTAIPTSSRYASGNFTLTTYAYICGGNNSATIYTNTDRYDMSTDSWTSKIAMSPARCQQGSAAVTASSAGYSTGGVSTSGGARLTTHDEYVENTWTNRTGIVSGRQFNSGIQC